MAVTPNKLSFRLTTQQTVYWQLSHSYLALCYICNQVRVFMLSARSGSCLIVSMAAMATYGEGLHLLGFSYRLPRKRCLALLSMVSLSICAVDSVLMLRVAPAESAFSTDRGQPSLPRKLQRLAPHTAR